MDAKSREAVFAALRAKGIKAIKVDAADGSKAKLDKHLCTDPLGLADEAIRQEWTDSRQIVVQR